MKFLDFFHLSADLPTRKEQLQALNLLVILLPDANRDTLKVSWLIYAKYPLEGRRAILSLFVGKQFDACFGNSNIHLKWERVLLRTDVERQSFTLNWFTKLLILLILPSILKRVYLLYMYICMPASMCRCPW